jgi:hypothetical protein
MAGAQELEVPEVEVPEVKGAPRRTQEREWVLDPHTGLIEPEPEPAADPQTAPEPQPKPVQSADQTYD